MKQRRYIVLITYSALLVSMLLVFSCMGEEPEPLSLQRLLHEGRLALEDGLGSVAYNYYEEALKIDPENSEAMWGITISTDQRIIAQIDGLIDLLAGVYVYEPSSAECADACERLQECGLLDEIRSSPETCMKDCPWGLQPFMFDDITASDTCDEVRHNAIDWILNTQPEDCVKIADTLEMCGNFQPPLTYDKQMFIERCPTMYVEHHSRCFVKHLGECSRKDRTCFEHTIVGFQVLFRELGVKMPPIILDYSEKLLADPDKPQFYLKTHWWELHDPPLRLDLPGRWGIEELYFSRALAHFFNFFVFTATSTNLDINVVTFDLHFENTERMTIDEILHDLIESMEDTLYDPIFPGALIAYDDPYSLALIEAAGVELGFMFGDFSRFLRYMMIDDDHQHGKALGYDDRNRNNIWDIDETLEFKGLGLTMNRIQAECIADMCEALELNLVFGPEYPFDLDLFRAVLDTYNLWYIDVLLRAIPGYGAGVQMDISHLFTDPDVDAFRNLFVEVVDILKELRALLAGSQETQTPS